MKMLILILTTIALTPIVVNADAYTPSHYCNKPNKPYEFTDQWQVDSYNSDVTRYKNCIESFVDEQNTATRNHASAADDAISDWNSFVRYN